MGGLVMPQMTNLGRGRDRAGEPRVPTMDSRGGVLFEKRVLRLPSCKERDKVICGLLSTRGKERCGKGGHRRSEECGEFVTVPSPAAERSSKGESQEAWERWFKEKVGKVGLHKTPSPQRLF